MDSSLQITYTNHLLDEIRGRRSEQDKNPVLDRIQRVEDLLQALLNRETQPEVIVSDPGPRQPSPTTSSISQSSIDRILNSYPRPEAPIAPTPQQPPSGISYARRLEQILRPDPLHLFDYAPVHRQYSDSPLSRIRVPLPPRPPSEPIPHMFRHPRETRGRRHVHPQTQTQTYKSKTTEDFSSTFVVYLKTSFISLCRMTLLRWANLHILIPPSSCSHYQTIPRASPGLVQRILCDHRRPHRF